MRPSVVAIVIALLVVVVGCDAAEPAGSPGPAAGAFVDVPWTAISIRGQAPVPGSEPSIILALAHVKGSGGCNQFGGDYRYDPSTGAIEFANLAMTAMGCLNAQVNSAETAFAQTLSQANRLAVDRDGRLHLAGPGGEIVFAKAVEG